jgi:hypothetical protein
MVKILLPVLVMAIVLKNSVIDYLLIYNLQFHDGQSNRKK